MAVGKPPLFVYTTGIPFVKSLLQFLLRIFLNALQRATFWGHQERLQVYHVLPRLSNKGLYKCLGGTRWIVCLRTPNLTNGWPTCAFSSLASWSMLGRHIRVRNCCQQEDAAARWRE
jgi:hypothetical protein